jgi:hypothetical protein
MGTLKSFVRERSTLGEGDVAAMAGLFGRYYEGATPVQFMKDLAAKTHVIELRDGGVLCGFSTLCVYDLDQAAGQAGPIRVIFSGDTLIDHAYWGEQALAVAFCRFAGAVRATDPARPLYWLLISKGHRTYRYLDLFACTYHPRHDGTEPAALARLAADLAHRKFGAAYDGEAGLVRFGTAATRLRAQWHGALGAMRLSPATSYFLQRNPQHALGDELVCLCELEAANLRSFALKAFREGMAGG